MARILSIIACLLLSIVCVYGATLSISNFPSTGLAPSSVATVSITPSAAPIGSLTVTMRCNGNVQSSSALTFASGSTATLNVTLTAPANTASTFSSLVGSNFISYPQNAYDMGIRRTATFSGWGMATAGALYTLSDWNNVGFTVRIDSTTLATFYVYGNNNRIAITGSYPYNTWYHLVGVMDQSKNQMFYYVNGALIGTQTLVEDITTSPSTIKVGTRGDLAGCCNTGYTANMQIYNIALSATQISTLYSKGLHGEPITQSGLLSWHPLTDNANDFSGNSVHATEQINTGTTTVAYATPPAISLTTSAYRACSFTLTGSGASSFTKPEFYTFSIASIANLVVSGFPSTLGISSTSGPITITPDSAPLLTGVFVTISCTNGVVATPTSVILPPSSVTGQTFTITTSSSLVSSTCSFTIGGADANHYNSIASKSFAVINTVTFSNFPANLAVSQTSGPITVAPSFTPSASITVMTTCTNGVTVSPVNRTFTTTNPQTITITTPASTTTSVCTFSILGPGYASFAAMPSGSVTIKAKATFQITTFPTSLYGNEALSVSVTPSETTYYDVSLTASCNNGVSISSGVAFAASDNSIIPFTITAPALVYPSSSFTSSCTWSVTGTDAGHFTTPSSSTITIMPQLYLTFTSFPTDLAVSSTSPTITVTPTGVAPTSPMTFIITCTASVTNNGPVTFPANSLSSQSFTITTQSSIGNFAFFTGSNSYIDLGINGYSLLNLADGRPSICTLAGWVYPTDISPTGITNAAYVISDWNGLGTTLRLEGDRVTFYVYANDNRIAITGSFPISRFHFLVGVMDGTEMRLYMNGALIGSRALEGLGDSPSTLKFGTRGDGTGSNFGWVANVQVYNTALSQSQITTLYNNYLTGNPIPNAGLIGWWKLNGDSLDYSGYGHHGTDYGVSYTFPPDVSTSTCSFINSNTGGVAYTTPVSQNVTIHPVSSFYINGWPTELSVGESYTLVISPVSAPILSGVYLSISCTNSVLVNQSSSLAVFFPSGSLTYQTIALNGPSFLSAVSSTCTFSTSGSDVAHYLVPAARSFSLTSSATFSVSTTPTRLDVGLTSSAISVTPSRAVLYAVNIIISCTSGATTSPTTLSFAAGATAAISFTVTSGSSPSTTTCSFLVSSSNPTHYATPSSFSYSVYYRPCTTFPSAPTNGGNVGDCTGSIESGSTCTMACSSLYTLSSSSTLTYTCGTNAVFTSTTQAVCVDNTAPVFGSLASRSVAATNSAGAVVSWTVITASDAVSGTLTASCSPASGSTFARGITTVTCSATDAAGNTASASFTVTVTDTTAPQFSTPSSITRSATSAAGAVVTWSAISGNDPDDGQIIATCSPPSGTTFSLGSHTVTCTASDSTGNSAQVTFTVTVVDDIAPVFSSLASPSVAATNSAGAVVSWTVITASDAVSGTLTASCSPASGSTFARGITTVTCSATDAAGNTASASFTVTVTDTTPPSFGSLPQITAVAATTTGGVVTWLSIYAVDAADGSIASVCTPPSGSFFGVGETTVSCSASDQSGNSASASFTLVMNAPGFNWRFVGPVFCQTPTNACGAQGIYSRQQQCYNAETDVVDSSGALCQLLTPLVYSTAVCTSYAADCVPSFAQLTSSVVEFPSALARFGYCTLHSPGSNTFKVVITGGVAQASPLSLNPATYTPLQPVYGVYSFDVDVSRPDNLQLVKTELGPGMYTRTYDHAMVCSSVADLGSNLFTMGGLTLAEEQTVDSPYSADTSASLRQACAPNNDCLQPSSVNDMSHLWARFYEPDTILPRANALAVPISNTYILYIGGRSVAGDKRTFLNDVFTINFRDDKGEIYPDHKAFYVEANPAPFTPRYATAGAFIKNRVNYGSDSQFRGAVIVAGGLTSSNTASNEVWVAHFTTTGYTEWLNAPLAVPAGFTPRGRMAYTVEEATQTLFVAGGVDTATNTLFNDVYAIAYDDIEYAYGILSVRTILQSSSISFTPRFSFGLAALGHQLFVFGGQGHSGALNDVWQTDLPALQGSPADKPIAQTVQHTLAN